MNFILVCSLYYDFLNKLVIRFDSLNVHIVVNDYFFAHNFKKFENFVFVCKEFDLCETFNVINNEYNISNVIDFYNKIKTLYIYN